MRSRIPGTVVAFDGRGLIVGTPDGRFHQVPLPGHCPGPPGASPPSSQAMSQLYVSSSPGGSMLVGQAPMDYLYGCRMRRAQTLLRTDRLTVAAIAAQVGYGSESALSAAFTRPAGTTPGAYRRTRRPTAG